jgi:hypothetical protein
MAPAAIIESKDTMRHIIYATAAITLVAAFATPNLALSQGGTVVCRPGGNCVTTSAAGYSHCVDLALRRGLQMTRGDRPSFDRFVYQCVAGRVSR